MVYHATDRLSDLRALVCFNEKVSKFPNIRITLQDIIGPEDQRLGQFPAIEISRQG